MHFSSALKLSLSFQSVGCFSFFSLSFYGRGKRSFLNLSTYARMFKLHLLYHIIRKLLFCVGCYNKWIIHMAWYHWMILLQKILPCMVSWVNTLKISIVLFVDIDELWYIAMSFSPWFSLNWGLIFNFSTLCLSPNLEVSTYYVPIEVNQELWPNN